MAVFRNLSGQESTIALISFSGRVAVFLSSGNHSRESQLKYYCTYNIMRALSSAADCPRPRRNEVARFANTKTKPWNLIFRAVFLLPILLCSMNLRAQSVCEIGNQSLRSDQPAGIAPAEIIRKFAAKETIFKAAREHYDYVLEVTVQTLTPYGQVDGVYHQISEFAPGKNGAQVETVTFAPQSTLRRLSLTQDDMDDIRIPLAVTTEELPNYSVEYLGRQHVDMLDTYVFQVSPKTAKNEKKHFTGRVWVDDQDFVIVKTCGKPRPDEIPRSLKKGPASITPMFVTYREEVDGKYWFPTYTKADEFLAFPRGDVHVREVIRYSDYRSIAAK
jgi:hypothetical protein